ncbi:MAG TPA: hypothetical protein VIU29_07520, partial [Candidatus Deferrimicrobiaceae bacterium]
MTLRGLRLPGVRGGISFKINLIVLAVVLLLGSALGTVFVVEQRRALEGELERRIRVEGARLARVLSIELHRGDIESVRRTLQPATLDREIAYLIVKGADGSPIAGRWAATVRGAVAEHEFPLRAAHRKDLERADNVLFGAASDPEERGAIIGTLSIGVDLGPQHSRVASLVARTTLMIAAAAALSLLIGNFFVRLLLKRSVEPLLDGIRDIGND